MPKDNRAVDVRAAVLSTYEYLQSLQDLIGQPTLDLRLEEVEFFDEDKQWKITLSFQSNDELIPIKNSRRYKAFEVDAETGDVKSMKIRTL